MNAVLNIAVQPVPSQKVTGFFATRHRLFIGGEWMEPQSGKYIDSGKKQGASVTVGGEAPSHPGYFVKPTVRRRTGWCHASRRAQSG